MDALHRYAAGLVPKVMCALADMMRVDDRATREQAARSVLRYFRCHAEDVDDLAGDATDVLGVERARTYMASLPCSGDG